jgi:hypothetical protein
METASNFRKTRRLAKRKNTLFYEYQGVQGFSCGNVAGKEGDGGRGASAKKKPAPHGIGAGFIEQSE